MFNSIMSSQASFLGTDQELSMLSLHPEESHHASFRVTQVEKQGIGYKALPSAQYLCHLTDHRVIFEALEAPSEIRDLADQHRVFEFPIEAIARFKLIRSLSLKVYAQIQLRFPVPPLMQTTLTLAVDPIGKVTALPYNYAQELVTIGNDLLRDNTNFEVQIQPDPAAIGRLQEAIATSSIPILVDFWAPECKPCQVFEPIIDEISIQFEGRIRVVKVNAMEEVATAIALGVDCFPTLLLLKDGKVIEKVVGAAPKVALSKMLSKHLTTLSTTAS